MTTDINAILARRASDAKKPTAKPVGTYEMTIVGHEFGFSKQKKTPYARLVCRADRCVALENPADQPTLDEMGNLSESRPISMDFYLTPDAEFRFTKFLGDILGLDTSQSYGVLTPQTKGLRFLAYVTKRPAKPDDPTNDEFYNDISSTAKLA